MNIIFPLSVVQGIMGDLIFCMNSCMNARMYVGYISVYVFWCACMYVQRRKSVYNFGGTEIGKIGDNASAEGVKLRLPKARSPSRLGGLGECRKLPQRGLGRSPRSRRDFEHFMQKWSTFYAKMEFI